MNRHAGIALTCLALSFFASAALAGPTLVWWQGESPASDEAWTPLHHLDGSAVGLLRSGDARIQAPGVRALGAWDADAPLYLVSSSTFDRLRRGEIPPAWRLALPPPVREALTREMLAAIPSLARDHAQVLVRLPEAMRAVADAPGGRCRRLRSPEEAALVRARAERRLDDWRRRGIDPDAPATPAGARTQPPEFWQSLVRAVNTDRFEADLAYLSTALPTRYAYAAQTDLACQYIYDEFAALGLQTSFDSFTWNGHALTNVLGVKLGTVDPSRIYIILGHLDSISPQPQTNAPGAEDNGSGSSAVLEAARLLAGLPSDYTIYFLCVTAEEQGLIGSEHFAAMADQQNLDLRGVLNFDMVGWYDPAGADLWIEGFRQGVSSLWLMQMVQQNAQTYAGLSTYMYPGEGWGSDHEPFHDHGFPAVLSIENEWDTYPCYHQTCDTPDRLTGSFWKKITAANVVTLGQLAQTQGALGAIDGTVSVAGGGSPQGATLRLSGTTYPPAMSDGVGGFTLDQLLPGAYLLTAELTGYDPVALEVVVPSGGVTEVQVDLGPPLPGTVRGFVRGTYGQPLAGARVEVEGQPVSALTGFDGTFTLGSVQPGGINLCASFNGLNPRGQSVLLAPGQELAGVDFVLESTWDFESSAQGLLASAGWQWGSDAVAGAHSGTRVWGTVLGGDYANCADYRLDLPPISLRSYTSARLRSWYWCRTENGVDGGNLRVSTDGGQTWSVVVPSSGYDGTLAGSCNPLAGEPGFTGSSGAWVERAFPLDAYIGRWVRLRLEFGADGAVTDRGWYIDDLALEGNFGASSVEGPGAGGDGSAPSNPDAGFASDPPITLSIGPNPTSRDLAISLRVAPGDTGSLSIFSAGGREVATLCASCALAPGTHQFTWDGRMASGNPAPAGTYFARWDGARGRATRTVIRVR